MRIYPYWAKTLINRPKLPSPAPTHFSIAPCRPSLLHPRAHGLLGISVMGAISQRLASPTRANLFESLTCGTHSIASVAKSQTCGSLVSDLSLSWSPRRNSTANVVLPNMTKSSSVIPGRSTIPPAKNGSDPGYLLKPRALPRPSQGCREAPYRGRREHHVPPPPSRAQPALCATRWLGRCLGGSTSIEDRTRVGNRARVSTLCDEMLARTIGAPWICPSSWSRLTPTLISVITPSCHPRCHIFRVGILDLAWGDLGRLPVCSSGPSPVAGGTRAVVPGCGVEEQGSGLLIHKQVRIEAIRPIVIRGSWLGLAVIRSGCLDGNHAATIAYRFGMGLI